MDKISEERVIAYSRAKAISDGVLVDITEYSIESDYKCTVAVSKDLYETYLLPDDFSKRLLGVSVAKRIYDMLLYFKFAAALNVKGNISVFLFPIDTSKGEDQVKVKAIVGPGDNQEPVLTMVLPYEL